MRRIWLQDKDGGWKCLPLRGEDWLFGRDTLPDGRWSSLGGCGILAVAGAVGEIPCTHSPFPGPKFQSARTACFSFMKNTGLSARGLRPVVSEHCKGSPKGSQGNHEKSGTGPFPEMVTVSYTCPHDTFLCISGRGL